MAEEVIQNRVAALRHVPCACDADKCAHNVTPPGKCVNRLRGDVRVMHCEACHGYGWHHEGQCLRCRNREQFDGNGTA